jgi:hypothetical protein
MLTLFLPGNNAALRSNIGHAAPSRDLLDPKYENPITVCLEPAIGGTREARKTIVLELISGQCTTSRARHQRVVEAISGVAVTAPQESCL